MKPDKRVAGHPDAEISALLETLLKTGRRLEELTAGEVDTVADRDGRTFLLRGTQDQLRSSEDLREAEAQEALRASERRYRLIVETTNEGVWLIDGGHQTTFMNLRMAQMLGCEADMAAGRAPFDFVDESGQAILAWASQLQEPHQVEVRYLRPDGTGVWMLLGLTPIFDGGRYDGLLAMAMDITDRKGATAELEELSQRTQRRERLLTTTLSSISDFAYIYDREGRFLFANQPLLDLWGITLEEAVGKNYFELGYPNKLAEQLQQQVQAVFEQKTSFIGETPYTSPRGVNGYYEYIFSPVFEAGEVQFVVGSTRDITQRRQVAEELKLAKDAAEAANRAKSEFLANMTHEMRTPMNAILGMAELLAESTLLEEQRDYVHVFQKSGANLLHLIDDILDLSKIESAQLELKSIGFDLRDLLQDIIAMMAPLAKNRGLGLALEVLPGVAAGLVGDPNRLRQIVINLVGNALKFTDYGAVALRVEADPGGGAGWIRFSVTDTGVGIAADKTAMIFDRFTQADSSPTRQHGGTGLGLAISKGLVELMGGRIGCTSEMGKGSTFSLVVPFKIQKDEEGPQVGELATIDRPAVGSTGLQRAARILIVEDSEMNVLLVKAYLKHSGYDLAFAENGKVGLVKTMAWNPDLVLMDLLMPVMDGLAATRAIRQWEAKTEARPRPILALTAHATGEGKGGSLEAGCNEHFTKPIKKATLLDAISRHLAIADAAGNRAANQFGVGEGL